jgi:hypothetical protein
VGKSGGIRQVRNRSKSVTTAKGLNVVMTWAWAQVLRVLQLNALQDRCVSSRADWDAAVGLMSSALQERLAATEAQLKELTGETPLSHLLY